MPTTATYFSDWKTRPHACECGWSGLGSELTVELFADLIQAACPRCPTNIVLVPYPTAEEIVAAAAGGNDEARGMLPQVERC